MMTRVMQRMRRGRRLHAVLSILALLPGCSTIDSVSSSLLGSGPRTGQPGYVSGFLGGVAADEPRAVIAGREVLSAGGTAADAAVAVGLTLAVTLPSRAGLGGGGACLAYGSGEKGPAHGVPEAVLFIPRAATGAGGDRPSAVPMLVRGLYLLHARYGNQPFESLVSSAEQLARFGVPVSRALARDLSVVAGPLFADPAARAIFSNNGVPLAEGQTLRQPDLGSTLAQIRVAGVGDMYQGALAHRIVDGSSTIGGPILATDLRAALPSLSAPLVRNYRNDKVAFLPPPADGGLGAEAAFDVLANNPNDIPAAVARSLGVVTRWRMGGVTPAAAMASPDLPQSTSTIYPASTSFVTMDRYGDAVACALTMNNLFGNGRILPGLGFITAASPAVVPSPLLAAGLVWNDNLKAFRAAAAASGQSAAPVAVAVGLTNTLRTNQPMSVPVPDPGRANIIACSRYLPGESRFCGWATDPRGDGLALGAN
ncbi:MAG TPA: gamma-glutamyltransferase [Rhodopila sp.]|uniref:gamma-glutamyltransferase n=1 Tax=Rhodopila sp. TaxID=2480087 RepID=UPI002C754AD8|nr:gamma-glutamyltransferase [Rhodopila sp.]HVY16875.1 gamma-glutamyltransferase [Rhodopila sp.]